MNQELNKRVCACVQATSETVNDYDQRSALGKARGWLENHQPVGWDPVQNKDQIEYKGRDQLAKDLVVLLEGVSKEDGIAALSAARAMINAPFLDPKMAGYRAARAERGVVGSEKKGDKMFGAQ